MHGDPVRLQFAISLQCWTGQ